jgi:hypothetical protein
LRLTLRRVGDGSFAVNHEARIYSLRRAGIGSIDAARRAGRATP